MFSPVEHGHVSAGGKMLDLAGRLGRRAGGADTQARRVWLDGFCLSTATRATASTSATGAAAQAAPPRAPAMAEAPGMAEHNAESHGGSVKHGRSAARTRRASRQCRRSSAAVSARMRMVAEPLAIVANTVRRMARVSGASAAASTRSIVCSSPASASSSARRPRAAAAEDEDLSASTSSVTIPRPSRYHPGRMGLLPVNRWRSRHRSATTPMGGRGREPPR